MCGPDALIHDDTVYSLNWSVFATRAAVLSVYALKRIECRNLRPTRSLCFLMRRKVNALMRASSQATEPISDAFGRPIYAYAGIPIGVIEQDKDGAEILAFDEQDAQATPADAACTSIYAVRFGAQEWVSGLQATGGMPAECPKCGKVLVYKEG